MKVKLCACGHDISDHLNHIPFHCKQSSCDCLSYHEVEFVELDKDQTLPEIPDFYDTEDRELKNKYQQEMVEAGWRKVKKMSEKELREQLAELLFYFLYDASQDEGFRVNTWNQLTENCKNTYRKDADRILALPEIKNARQEGRKEIVEWIDKNADVDRWQWHAKKKEWGL